MAIGPWLVAASLLTLLCPHTAYSPRGTVSPPPLLRAPVILGPILLQDDLVFTYILITSAKALFPKMVTFTGPGD